MVAQEGIGHQATGTRAQWGAIRSLKRGCGHSMYGFRDKHGRLVPEAHHAEATADSLATFHWAPLTPDAERRTAEARPQSAIAGSQAGRHTVAPPTVDEIAATMSSRKKKEAGGPEGITTKHLQAFDETNRPTLAEMIRDARGREDWGAVGSAARVVSIYKRAAQHSRKTTGTVRFSTPHKDKLMAIILRQCLAAEGSCLPDAGWTPHGSQQSGCGAPHWACAGPSRADMPHGHVLLARLGNASDWLSQAALFDSLRRYDLHPKWIRLVCIVPGVSS